MKDTTPRQFDDERLAARFEHLACSLEGIQDEIDRSARLATLGTLAGMIAHEFRNLLVPVSAYAQMAIQHPEDRDLSAQAHHTALAAADRATQITESILALAGDQAPTSDSASVANAVAQLYTDGSTIEHQIDPTLCVGMFRGDLTQVFQNLVNNASRAMGGGGVVKIHGSRINCSTGNKIVIEICDTGSGIDPDLIDTIFEPHVSGSGGSGLGLSLCQKLIERASGSISVESETGKGTCFRIELPEATPAAEPHHPDGS